jgi:hypothetical protein
LEFLLAAGFLAAAFFGAFLAAAFAAFTRLAPAPFPLVATPRPFDAPARFCGLRFFVAMPFLPGARARASAILSCAAATQKGPGGVMYPGQSLSTVLRRYML